MIESRRDEGVRRFEIVAACTRALAGSARVDLSDRTNRTANLARLRAAGDRAAVRHRFHDPICHDMSRPRDRAAAAIFEALEEARLDVRGVQWLPGVGVNLLGDAGPDSNAVRWLTFRILSGRQLPDTVAPDVARLEREIAPAVLNDLHSLRSLVEDQPAFARASAACAMAAAWNGSLAERPADPEQSGVRSRPPQAPRDDRSRDGLPEDAAADVDARRSEQRSRQGAAGRGLVAEHAAAGGYTAYTTAYDRVVDAASLVDPATLAQLRARLDREMGETRLAVTRLANRLRRLLMARQTKQWQFDLDEGWVDGRRLAEVVASAGEARLFKQEADAPLPAAAVSLLIDHSGSMRGRPILIAALTVDVLVQALERCGISCEVLGFTTREWDGGRPAHDWAAAGGPPHPGRLNALEHIVFKAADVPWRRARAGLGLALRDEALRENIDGEAVAWAHARLCRRPEHRRLLLVVSDGAPRDDATDRANGDGYLGRHLRNVVDDIEARSPVRIAAIGIGHDVSRFYSRAMTIVRIEDLAGALTRALASFLAPGPVARAPAAPAGPGGRARSL